MKARNWKWAALALALGAVTLAAEPFVVDATLPAGNGPNASAVGLDGRLLVVANSDSGDVSLIDLEGETGTVHVPVGKVPMAVALSADTQAAYVACFQELAVAFVDLRTGSRTHLVDVGVHPRDLVRLGGTLLVSGYYEGELVSIDIQRGVVDGRLTLEAGLSRLRVHPDGRRVYALNTSRDRLYEVSVGPLQLLAQLGEELGYMGNWDMVLSQDGSRLIVSGWGGDRLAVLRTDPLSVRGFVPTHGDGPCALAMAPDGETVVVAHSESDDAAVVDVQRMHVRRVLPVGAFPFSDVRITEDGRFALVTADNARKLAVLDLERLETTGHVAVGKIPHVITPGPGGRYYVSNVSGGSVSVVRRTGRRERLFELLGAGAGEPTE